jgi:hypothetical protein
MSTLAADKRRVFELNGGYPDEGVVPIIASDIVYAGAAVGESTTTGTYRPLAGGDVFAGFAMEKCDNASGAASAKLIKILRSGVVKNLPVTGLDNVNDAGATVYATTDDDFTLTASGASSIGKVERYSGTSGYGDVYFEGESRRSI